MKSLKETFRSSKARIHDPLVRWLRPKVSAFGQRHRLAPRIRIANRWARKHPKKTFAYMVVTLLTVIFTDLTITAFSYSDRENPMTTIATVEPIFDGFRAIQANKQAHQEQILSLAAKGRSVKSEIDSLIAIPEKSHSDSITIIQRYRQLQTIANSLKNNE